MSTQGREPYGHEVRLRAARLVCRDGWKTADVAQTLGCSKRAVELWLQKSDRGRKPAAIETGKATGATPKLNPRLKQRLLKWLAAGPKAAWFSRQLWTCPRIAQLILRKVGVSNHIG
jgi:transposase